MPLIAVTKCHGTGNDFVLLDARGVSEWPYAAIAKELCHRRFSLGADGLLVIGEPTAVGLAVRMRTFNADGSEAEMCGNGIRCVTLFLHEENPDKIQFDIETVAGVVRTDIATWQGEPGVRVVMGVPQVARIHSREAPNVVARIHSRAAAPEGTFPFAGQRYDAYDVSMGNPHTVVFGASDPSIIDLNALAAAANGRANVDAANVEYAEVGSDCIHMRVRERGVGETWACGTGACAVAAAAVLTGRAESPVVVHSRGGAVRVEWAGPGHPAYLTGDAHLVYRTEVNVLAALSQVAKSAGSGPSPLPKVDVP
jgi:diaminopimelate epimerase